MDKNYITKNAYNFMLTNSNDYYCKIDGIGYIICGNKLVPHNYYNNDVEPISIDMATIQFIKDNCCDDLPF